jgi:hypothetical protein
MRKAGPPNTKTMTTHFEWKNRRFLQGYVVAFPVCWATQAIFWGVSGHRGSLLAFALLRFEEFLRVGAEKLVGREVISYPPSSHAGSVVFAALLAALPLAGVFWMAGAENRALRWSGYAALAFLAFMTFYWPSIPRDLF